MSLATVMLTVLNNTQSPIMAIFKMRSSRQVARFQRRSIRYHSVILSLTADYSFNNPQISYSKFTCMNYIIIEIRISTRPVAELGTNATASNSIKRSSGIAAKQIIRVNIF